MIHRYRFVPALNLLMMQFGSQVDDRSLLEFLLQVYEHPDFVQGMDELVSFLDTTEPDVTSRGLAGIARTFPLSNRGEAPPNLVAVATRTPLGRGLARQYAAYADREGQVRLEVVESVEEGADWLDQCRNRAPGTTREAVKRLLV